MQVLGNDKRNGRKRAPVRWLTFLVIFGAVLVSGTVAADVILAYTVNNSVGANATSPFKFVNGSNYAKANSLGMATNVYPSGVSGPTVTTTISGVQSVPAELLDVTEFDTGVSLPATATLANVNVPAPSVIAPANVVCAYAFISTAAPAVGTVGVAGMPAGCAATTPSLGAVSAGCGGSATAQVATINLLTGVVTGSIATSVSSCTVASGTAANTIVLYVSYAITTNGAVVTTALNSFTIPITL